ncbi:unnamed protein product, partial [Staurois parvus]
MYTVITYSLRPPRQWRGCLLSAEESGPLLHLSPQRRCRRSRKPELGFAMRLGAQPLHHLCLPLENFSSHLASRRAAFSSP